MSSLHGTQAMFDPLSAAEDTSDGAFTTVFDSTPVPAAQAPGVAAAGPGTPPPEYDSFMTARSAMSYMTSSQGGTAASGMMAATATGAPLVAPAAPSPFRRLPDRAVPPLPPLPVGLYGAEDGSGGGDLLVHNQHPLLSQPNWPMVLDDADPFTAVPAAPPPPPSASVQWPATAAAVSTLGPLSFGDGLDASAAPNTAATFAVPLDLYDTPDDAFARPAATAAVTAPPPPPLPPLFDFTREFSRMLPVSEDPTSPAGATVASGVGWYDNGGGGAAAAAAAAGGAGAGAGPSGAGSVLSSVTAAGVAGGWAPPGGGGITSYAAAALLTNTVSVHSPKKMVSPSRIPGLSELYTVYRVTSRSAVSPETTVDRRFRDVVALAELLQVLYPGCFLPPRPSRNAVEGRRMQPEFIEERRGGIEKFLKRLVVHPVLGPSEATQVWLHAPASNLRTAPEWLRLQPTGPPGLAKSTAKLLFQVVGRERTVPSPADVTRPAYVSLRGGDVYRVMHERAAQMRGVLGGVQPTRMEEKLREEAVALQDRTEALLDLSRRADQLVARSAKVGRAAAKLGGALAAEAAAEEAGTTAAAATPAAALRIAAEGLEKVGKLYGVATDASAKHLTPIHDWLAAVPGCTAALAARERCLLTLATLQADEGKVTAALAVAEAKLGGGGGVTSPPTAAMRKLDSLRLQVSQLSVAVTAASDEYERVGGRNASELAAFKAYMSRELADAVREYALVQLAAAQKAHDIWAGTAGQLATIAAAAAATAAAAAAAAGGPGGSSGPAIGFGIGGGGDGGMYGGVYGS